MTVESMSDRNLTFFTYSKTGSIQAMTMSCGLEHWSNYQKVFRGPYGERGAQAYNGGLGQSLN